MQKPPIGSYIKITTDSTESLRGFANHVVRKRYLSGMVIESDRWVDEDSFTLYTGKPGFPKSVVAMSLVHAIEYINSDQPNEVKEKAHEVKIERFSIPGSKGNLYEVTHHGDRWECTCIAGQHGRACKHVTAAKLSSVATVTGIVE